MWLDKFEVFRDTVSDTHPFYHPYVKVSVKDRITGFTVRTFNKDEEVAIAECRKVLWEYRWAFLKNKLKCFCITR